MNYNSPLDSFFSNPWLGYGIIVIYFFIVIWFNKKLFPDRIPWLVKSFFTIGVPFIWIVTLKMLNPALLGYGKSEGVNRLAVYDGKLFVIDYLVAAGGGRLSKGSPCYRLHVIEPATGNKIRRSSLYNAYRPGSVRFTGDTMILTQPSDVKFYSVATGKKINTWSSKTLPALFPQLSSGVGNLEPNSYKEKLVINSLDGNKWVLDIMSNMIAPYDSHDQNKYEPTGKLYLDENNGIRRDDQRFGTTVVTYGSVKGSDNKMMLMGPDTVLNRHISFLHGSIIAVSEKQDCFVIRDYDKTTETGVGFVCMSLDGHRKLWEVREKELRPGKEYEKRANTCYCIDELNHIFFANIKNEVYAINMSDGKLLWRQVP